MLKKIIYSEDIHILNTYINADKLGYYHIHQQRWLKLQELMNAVKQAHKYETWKRLTMRLPNSKCVKHSRAMSSLALKKVVRTGEVKKIHFVSVILCSMPSCDELVETML